MAPATQNPNKKEFSDEIKAQLLMHSEELARALEMQRTAMADIPNKQGDTRIVTNFSPFNMEGKSLVDPEVQNEYHEFGKAYYSGDPKLRKPYLDKMFDELEHLKPNIDLQDADQVSKLGKDAVRIPHLATYAENLIKDNPSYFAARYNDPVKRAELMASLAICTSLGNYATQIFQEYGYNANTGKLLKEDQPAPMPWSMAEGLAQMQRSDGYAKSLLAAANGEPLKPLTIVDVPFMDNNSCKIADAYKSGHTTPQQQRAAAEQFDLIVRPCITGNTVSARLVNSLGVNKDRALNTLDMVFIDGKNVKDIYAEKYKDLEGLAKERAIKGEVIAALGAGKGRVEIANIMEGPDGKDKAMMQSISLDVRDTQPSKKEEYGRIRRAFDFGPFKCKSRQERIDGQLAKDPHQEERHKAIEEKLNPIVEKESVKWQAKSAGENAKDVISEQREKEAALDNKFFSHINIKEKDELNKYFGKLDNLSSLKSLNRERSRASACHIIMLAQGCTVDELNVDSPRLDEMRAKAGQTLTDLAETAAKSKDDPTKGNEAVEKIAELVAKGSMILARSPFPDIDYNSPKLLCDNYVDLHTRALISVDCSQFVTPVLQKKLDNILTPAETKAFEMLGGMGAIVGDSAAKQLNVLINYNAGTVTKDSATILPAFCAQKFLEKHTQDIRGQSVEQISQKIDPMALKLDQVQMDYAVQSTEKKMVKEMFDSLTGGSVAKMEVDANHHYSFGGISDGKAYPPAPARKAPAPAPVREKVSLKELAPTRERTATTTAKTNQNTLEKKSQEAGKH